MSQSCYNFNLPQQTLLYPGQDTVISDADTANNPVSVLERPIRQRIKVTKDIQTNPDGSYANNTYDYEAVKKVTNFRFKAYLKSNLERLYRAEDGTVTWLDRNGNEISYQDMLTSAFPAVGHLDGDKIVKTNVEKIFTKVDHDTSSKLTSINGNNIDADYKDPETANREAAWKTPYSTVIAPGGIGVIVNSALYSFRGNNTNVAQSDTIRGEQNGGYTRILETVEKKVESGTDTITVQEYNYEKFFDAIEVANVDKWDDQNQTYTSWKPLGNAVNRTEYAVNNAKASDMMRQFAIKWYLDDEVAKLVKNNTQEEDEGKGDETQNNYTEEVYDEALNQALAKAYNYMKPFFAYDLDAIYALPWDSAAGGGADKDTDTLSADTDGTDYFYAASSYLPYGTYVVVEQQPKYVGKDQAAFNDFVNKHYKIDQPKEVSLPALYEDGTNTDAVGTLNKHYIFKAAQPLTEQAKKANFLIRFGEEWDANGGDQRQYVIWAHNDNGDFEVYKYGLEPDKLVGTINYDGGNYDYKGFQITQEQFDPLKDYYNPLHKVYGKALAKEQGANENSHYLADDGNKGSQTANGEAYESDAVEARYQYGSISEQAGEARDIRFEHEAAETPDNGAGAVYKNVKAMQGVQKAYDGLYAPMLVPFSVLEPTDEKQYNASDFAGYADGKYRNTFYSAKLRIEKIDSETHENLLHDGALFMIYKAQRDEKTGYVKFYEEDTTIVGSEEFLKAMNAENIQPLERGGRALGVGEMFSGVVKAGTPICEETDKVVLSDAHGNDVGQFEAFSTINDVSMKDEDTNQAPNEYRRQTTGYLDTPQPLGAGVYVLAEVPPRGYVRTKPIAVEVYSDKVTYYKEGNRDNRVHAAIYEYTPDGARGNLNKPQDEAALAQIYVENTPIKLQIEKVKPNGDVTFKVGTRIEGSLTEIGGNPDLVYAYVNGQYLGYAYEKGTFERLKAMKDAGEQVEIVYEGGQFAGYGYVTKTRETDDDTNKYVAGAKMTLFDAIELTPSGDTEDHAFEGLQINRNNTGNILEMFVKKGYAGKKTEMVKETDADGKEILTDYVVGYDDKGNPITKQGYTWKEGTVERPDTDILYYDLDSLSVTWTERIDNRDILFGWDKNHQKVAISQIESDKQNHNKSDREPSIYAFKGGQAVFEFVGGDFTKIKYNSTSKILEGNFAQLKFVNKVRKWKMGEGTIVYHLDRNGNRDAMVDPYTGMAYVLEPVLNDKGEHIWDRVLVWPINIAKDEYGNIISRDKITTSRIATVGENQDGYNENVTLDPTNQNPGGQEITNAEKPGYSHQESGFINGTWKSDGGEESHRETTLNTNKQRQNMNEDILLNDNNGDFLKYMSPVYDEHGLVLYYQRSNETYDKGTNLYDRNGDFVRYKDSDNLEEYNKAAYALDEHGILYDGVSDQEVQTQDRLYHRKGESYILENTWMTSDKTPNDPFASEELAGQADLLTRLPAGTYIMEELAVPEGKGYTIALPTGITVEESSVIKRVEVVDDTTKLIIEKTDEPTKDKVDVLDMSQTDKDGNYVKVGESKAEASEYGYTQIAGAKIALYPAKYTIDLSKPEGYRLDKTSNDPFVFETTNSNIAAVERLTASWTTGAAPIYLEGIPAGYYILEELAVPENQGFVKSEPVYVHVISDKEIQSFKMADDHTKVAIWKYKLESGKKETLPGAEFGLYEALLDGNGNVVMKDGVPQYDKTKRIDAFTSNDASDYTDSINLKDYPNTNGKNQILGFTSEFEKMYAEYGVNGKGFSWSVERTAIRDNADSNVWVLENGSRVVVGDGNVTFPADMSREDREGFKAAYADMIGKKLMIKWASNLTASVTDVQKIDAEDAGGAAQKYPAVATVKISVAETGKVVLVNVRYNGKEFDYSYKFDYEKLSVNDYANAWLTADGMRRIDYLPSGMKLVLVEEKAPTGFALAKPQVIEVKGITDVQLHDVVNEQNALLITKRSSETGKEFAGNKLALYRADEAGKLTKTDEYLVEEWTSGEDGTYTENDLINGLIPDGFKEGDLKPHYIYNLADGKYFLTEAKAQDYYRAFEPIEINYAGGQLIQVVEAVNHPITGKLIVNKTDAEGGKLHGVVFELSAFDKAGNMVEGFPKQVTDTNGVVTVSGLPVGSAQADGTFVPYTYKLREITPPTGFAVNNTVYSFQFKNGEEDYTKDPSVEFTVNEIDVKNQKTKFYIEKKDLTKLNDAGTDGAFIDGAVLAIYRVSSITEDGKYTYNPEDLFEQWTSSKKEGKHFLEGLVAGQSYVFVEKKAPAGYTLMKPVLITVSADGRSISEVTNNMSIVKVEKVQGSIDNPDTDSIAALTVKGRIIQKTEVAVLDSNGKEVLRFAGADGEHVIEKTDALKENEVYTFAEHTLYSDGCDVITAKVTRRVRFGENGFVYRGRQAKSLNIQVTDEEGNVLSEFAPTEEKLEQVIDNNLRPENPRVIVKNRNGDAGEPLTKGQPVINTISYYNPSPKEADVSVEAVLASGASVLDPYSGTAEENTVRWTIKKVAPYTQGSVSFASAVNEDASSVSLSVTAKAAGKIFETTKQVPVKQENSLTVYNELTGSGKELHQGETSEFTIRLFDERGDELAGSYAYTGSKEGMLRSGDTITLAGNEFITIDPANFRNCTYEVTRADNGLEIIGYDLKGVITEEGSSAWFTRSVADTSERQIFSKGSTYFLTETTAYTDGEARISNKFSFTLNENASISAVGGYDKETKVSLSKTDFTTGEELPGNHMQIVDKDGNVVEEWISGDKPHEITGLTPGESYTLKETSPKDGYSYAEDIQFTVNEDGTVDSVVMEDKPTYIQVSKKDITNDEELPGATLEIIDKNGTVVEKWVSTDKPHEIIGKLIADETYTLRETIAPDGFVIANEIKFTVSHDGSIDYVEMIDDTTKVRIYKNVFTETATPSTPSNADKGQALAGSTLQILNENKTPFLYHGEELIFTTGESFKLLEKTLVAGRTYWLHEVKPTPGYAYAEDVKFTVSLDGSIDIVLMEDKPTDVILSKKAITGEDELPGNKMQLVDKDGNVIEEWTSGDKPHEIKGKLEADKEYRLIEVKSKDGYAYAEDVIFTVNHDGTPNLVEMRDDVTKVEILKVSKGTNRPLAGAEFELLDKSGTVVEKWVSTSEPYKIYGKLIAGETYTLRETKAPSGYKKMADVPVTVNLTADVLTVTAENTKTPGDHGGGSDYTIRLRKVDENGNALAGAAFKATGEYDGILSITKESGGIVFAIHLKRAQKVMISEISAPDGYHKLEGTYEIEIPSNGDAILLNGDEQFYQDSANSYVFYAVNTQTPPETPPEETPPTPQEHPKKGKITAEFDKDLNGIGKFKLNYDGSVVDLTAKTGDDFPLGLLLSVFVGSLLAALGAAFMYFKKKNGNGPKNDPPKGGASGSSRMAVRLPMLLLFAALSFNLYGISAQAAPNDTEKTQEAGVKEDVQYREKTYLSDTDKPEEQKAEFDPSITIDGKTYVLDSVNYEVQSKKKLEAPEGNIKIVTSAPFVDEESNHVPEGEMKEGGKSYYLKSYEVVDTKLDARTEPVSDTITYSNIPVDSKIPEMAKLSVKDSVTGKNVEVQVPLSDKEFTEPHWISGFEFPITVSNYDAGVFDLNGREITLSEDAPLKGHENELLNMIGVSAEDYRINSIAWDGGSYTENGVVYRKLKATGEMRVTDCKATYAGVANLPEVDAKAVQAVYSDRRIATASNAAGTGTDGGAAYSYTMKATAKYVTNTEPLKQKSFLDRLIEFITNPVVIAVLLTLLFIVLVIWLVRRKKKKESDKFLYISDDDEEDE